MTGGKYRLFLPRTASVRDGVAVRTQGFVVMSLGTCWGRKMFNDDNHLESSALGGKGENSFSKLPHLLTRLCTLFSPSFCESRFVCGGRGERT